VEMPRPILWPTFTQVQGICRKCTWGAHLVDGCVRHGHMTWRSCDHSCTCSCHCTSLGLCVCSRCFGETLSTLNFAKRAKMIRNKVQWRPSLIPSPSQHPLFGHLQYANLRKNNVLSICILQVIKVGWWEGLGDSSQLTLSMFIVLWWVTTPVGCRQRRHEWKCAAVTGWD